MCGINGIFAYHAAANLPKEAELLFTREAMRARGPDGAGAWWSRDRRCGLGHRRLSVIDLSERAAQPMTSEDGRLVVVFNGEIYNYPELRAKLEADGARLRTTSDTEVLLHLYARSGARMVHELRGMFAFAIWDETRRSLFLARDPYGIKPLYTANDGWTFRFASQVKALLAGNQVSRDAEPAGIVGFHLFGNVPEPFTLYREIRLLPAGYTQWIDSDGLREPKRFASITEVLATGALNPQPPGDFCERLRGAVVDSVRAHLLADVEVGLFLSAGVDSGALLGVMRDVGRDQVRAITLGFAEFRGSYQDEVPLAAQISQLYGANHIIREVNTQEFCNDFRCILESMDQPSIDGVNAWFVSKAAKEAGLKVVLSGLGGDELLGGYPSFVDLPRWRSWFGSLGHLPGLASLTRNLVEIFFPGLAQKRPKAIGLLEYSKSWPGAYLVRRGLFLPHELPSIVGPEIAREGLRRLNPVRRLGECLTPDPGSSAGRVCALESCNYMRMQLLRDTDWAGMAHGVEIRMPLVDFTLLNSMASFIPTLRPGLGKSVLANVPIVPLPAENVLRAKTGFRLPTGAWMPAITGKHSSLHSDNIGLVARAWSQAVLSNWIPTNLAAQMQAA